MTLLLMWRQGTEVMYAGYLVTKPNVEIHSIALQIDHASALHSYACPLGQ